VYHAAGVLTGTPNYLVLERFTGAEVSPAFFSVRAVLYKRPGTDGLGR
jgi:hypothetical protein